MVDRVIEERPADRVIVDDRRTEHVRDTSGNNTGVIIAVIILLIVVLALVFGRGLFGGGGSSSPDVNVTPSTSSGQ
jgi:Na+-translocating ferredoxin:NAD+ oxidoreductase RnfD subunit